MKKIIVIGGGAAGMAASVSASKNSKVILLEGNEKLGKKIYITGKGRCNCTNDIDMSLFSKNYPTNPKFTYSMFNAFTNQDLIEFLKENGTDTKVERGNRVFPVSDHASDITKAFEKAMKKNHVDIKLNEKVTGILYKTCKITIEKSKYNLKVYGVKTDKGNIYECDKVIIATGGLSYPSTGSTGDGYKFSKKMGHTITPLYPSLVPLILKEKDIKNLQGLSLKNVELYIRYNKKKAFKERGEMLFTRDGISGPLVLTASSVVGKYLEEFNDGKNELLGYIDLKPALSREVLENRVKRELLEKINTDIKNVLLDLLPHKMINVFIERLKIRGDLKSHDITKEVRNAIIDNMKEFKISVVGLGRFEQAVITKGGVDVKEINSSTMESKIVKDLYFAGEVIDVDGFTGGFNLQFAFSSGFLAGHNAGT